MTRDRKAADRRGAGLLTHRAIVVLLTLVAAVLLLLGRMESAFLDRLRTIVMDVSAPVLAVVAEPVSWVADVGEAVFTVWTVHEENQRLRAENAQLLQWKEAALALEQKVSRYEALLNVQTDPLIDFFTARVVGDTGGPFVHSYIVNAGRGAGAEKGQAVVSGTGLVGRVVGVGENASRVLLITDLNSRIPVMVEPANVRAILSGDNSEAPTLSFLPAGAQLKDGDRVVTSGDAGTFPPNVPVGVVAQSADGAWRVTPFAGRQRIDYVRVLKYRFPADMDADTAPAGTADPAAPAANPPGAPASSPGTPPAAAPATGAGAVQPAAAAAGVRQGRP